MRLLRSFLTVLILFGCFTAAAQTLEVHGPSIVAMGRSFQLEFSIDAQPDGFTAPEFDGFDVLAGPTSSRMRNVVFDGTKLEEKLTYAYTYVLMPNRTGVLSIPPATVTADGKSYRSKPLPIEVVAEQSGAARAQQPQGAGGNNRQQPQDSPAQIQQDDILLRVTTDKTSAFKGEPVRVTIKLYSRVPIAGRENWKLPSFNGFWVQELNTAHYAQQRETYNNKVYDTVVLGEYLIYPQQSGTLQVEQTDITVIAQLVVQSQRRSLFDDFFGGIPDIKQVSRRLTAPAVPISVAEWPVGAPSSFNGAVGNFTMSADFPTDEITANSSANYTVKIAGTGNLPLIQAPLLDIPQSFEQYNIKTTESLQRSTSGISGYRQFEYPLIARAEGDFTIEPIQFTYFDPKTTKYVTLTTPEYNVTVHPDSEGGRSATTGVVSGLSKEDVRMLGQDIRFIKLGFPYLRRSGEILLGSAWYWAILIFIVLMFSGALVYLRKRIEQMRNEVAMRGKRANKVALQRLRAAEAFMKQESQRNFYEEMLKALWGYMSDKLNIPAANLTKDNIREELMGRGISAEQTSRYIELLTECEYAQYSPAGTGQMNEIYHAGLELISRLETRIKK